MNKLIIFFCCSITLLRSCVTLDKEDTNIIKVDNYKTEKIKIKTINSRNEKIEWQDITKDHNEYKMFSNYVEIDSLSILLRFDNNTKTILKDNIGEPYDEDRVHYTYKGYSKNINSFIVESDAYEDHSFFLYSKETGVQKEIDNIPHISTKGQLLFTYVHTPFAENDSLPNVYLYLVNKNIELIAKITTKKEIKEYFWKDEHTIFFKFFDHQVNGIKIITQR